MKVIRIAAGVILMLGVVASLARLVAPSLAAPQVANEISGSVFRDDNQDGILDAGEPGAPDVELELYRDENGNGLIDKHDHRIAKTTTDAAGGFIFSVTETGDFLVKIDTKSLPKGSALTTLNRQAASFNEHGTSRRR